MKVYVTQGHEKGVGLEVFFKSCLFLKEEDLKNILFLGFKASAMATLKTLHIPFEIAENGLTVASQPIAAQWLEENEMSESFAALKKGMSLAEEGGVLFTLPTSKDQFPGYPGHTEYFRHNYSEENLGMFFSSPSLQVLLLSDHVAINDLSQVMTEELIYGRLKMALTTFQRWKWPISRVLVSGFNPHAGEGGLIGNEDSRVTNAIKRVRSELKIDIIGPYPGDTMLLEKKSSQDLLVYLFHDQGLSVFKGLQGFIGSNITLGLPYPRFSPDHGTSFALYGKNLADYRGCEFSLKEALQMLKKGSHGKNSSYKGKSS